MTQIPNPTDAELLNFGYAPGFYIVNCVDCPPEHRIAPWRMAAKRSYRCEEHARIAWENHHNVISQTTPPPATTPVAMSDGLVERVAKALAAESGVSDWKHVGDHGEYDSRDYWRRLAQAALSEVRAVVEEREATIKALCDAIDKARNLVPDEDGGVAAGVFCYFLNKAQMVARASLGASHAE